MSRRAQPDLSLAPAGSAPKTARKARADAREELLRATEQVLATVGPQAATVRTITGIAGTNTSAINYYFESRENLLAEVGRRRMDSHNVGISRQLEALWRPGSPLRVEDIFRPLVETAFNVWGTDPVLRALRTMTIIEPSSIQGFSDYEVNQIYTRMLDYLMKACPHLAPDEIEWRFRLALNSIVHTVMVSQDVQTRPVLGKQVTAERMISFVSAPFKLIADEQVPADSPS